MGDEGATVTFATKFHWLSKAETADNMMSFSVKVNSRKGKNRSKRIGFDIFAKKNALKHIIFIGKSALK